MRDFLAGCNGLSRGFTVNKAADAVRECSCFMQLPLTGRKNLLYGNATAGGKRKQINDQFVHEIVVEKPPEQFHRFRVGYFGQIGTGIVLVVLLCKQVQDGMGQNQGITAFAPIGKTSLVAPYPSHQHVVGFRKKPVQCHHRYSLDSWHIFRFLISTGSRKKEACKHTTSNGGSGKPLKGIGECTLCVGIA